MFSSEEFVQRMLGVLERMTFILAEPGTPDGPPDYCVHAKIRYSRSDGSAKGELYISADSGFVSELCESMLGMEPGEFDLDEVGPQALCELANVCGGEVVMMLGGADAEFDLSLPEACQNFGGGEDAAKVSATLSTQEGWVQVVAEMAGFSLPVE